MFRVVLSVCLFERRDQHVCLNGGGATPLRTGSRSVRLQRKVIAVAAALVTRALLFPRPVREKDRVTVAPNRSSPRRFHSAGRRPAGRANCPGEPPCSAPPPLRLRRTRSAGEGLALPLVAASAAEGSMRADRTDTHETTMPPCDVRGSPLMRLMGARRSMGTLKNPCSPPWLQVSGSAGASPSRVRANASAWRATLPPSRRF